ncbi:uncharacterized protein LOC143614926 [Bidens hawaiensis]|uniref:uncharacterized protein LOC143614926 n=1 Tax=Bidens hawaiensis TaxID=980011 RepID=UPI004049C646
MRRSYGPRMGVGGGMLKTVHRAMRFGIGGNTPQESYATRSNNNNNNQHLNPTLTLNNINSTSPPRSYLNHPVPEPHNWFTTSPAGGEEYDWEYVGGGGGMSDGDSVHGFYDDYGFGGVPTEQEVQHAVSSLHEVLEPIALAQLTRNRDTCQTDDDSNYDEVEKISSPTSLRRSGSGLDWSEPSMQLCYSTSALQKDNVLNAFHLLQTEPSVQRMVASLSKDPAVWGAIWNNEVVRKLRESIREDQSVYDEGEARVDDSNPVSQVLRWIFANTKDKVIEMLEKISKVVNELVQPMMKDEKVKKGANAGLESFEEKLRNSFFLSIVVLLIVVVSRSGKH